MRKFYLLLIVQLFLLPSLLWSQVKLTVELQSDSITYMVKLKPDMSYSPPMNTTNNAQITFVVPSGGFQPGPVSNIKGLWSEASSIVAPEENPTNDYIMFTLQSGTSDISYTEGEEVELFSFQNTGVCTGNLAFVLEDDPFFPPNSQSVNIGNQISVLGAGFINAFSGTYGNIANCLGGTEDTITEEPTSVITIDSVILNSPADCGEVNGSIEIIATHQDGNLLQYSVDGGETWVDTSVVANLQGGIAYNIQVRDNIGLNFEEYGEVRLENPIVAVVATIEANTPTCVEANGSILIEAENINNDQPLRYSIDNGETWQTDNGNFQNLPSGSYQPIIGAEGTICIDELDPILLVASPCPDEEEGGELDSDNNTGQPNEEEEEGAEGQGDFIDSLGFVFTDEVTCPFAFILNAEEGVYTISILSDTTLTFPRNITSTAQIVIKVPTGGFTIENLTNLISGVVFSDNSRSDAPIEAPNFDYISFGLDTRGTQAITYEKGQKIPLFSFTNGGTCTEGSVTLMDNTTDPFLNNSSNANVNQQITVSGLGSDAEVCVSSITITDCGIEVVPTDTTTMPMDTTTMPVDTTTMPMDTTTMPVDTTTMPSDSIIILPGGDPTADTFITSIFVDTKTTLCLDTLVDLDTIASISLCNPEGDVIVTPNIATGCLELEPKETFEDAVEICVLFCDDANSCDTVFLSLCPKVSLGIDLMVCDGETVKLNPTGIGTYNWTTTENISCTDCQQPDITPTTTADYIVVNTTPKECSSNDTLTITVMDRPALDTILQTAPTDCQDNGSITVQLIESSLTAQYSIDNGESFQDSNVFDNLGQGDYQVQVRTENTCQLATSPIIQLEGDIPFSIDSVLVNQPNTCRNTMGSIMMMITVDSMIQPSYSIDNGATWSNRASFDSLTMGTYNLLVRTPDSSCTIAYQNNPVILTTIDTVEVIDGLEDRTFCVDGTKVIRLTLSEEISDFEITGDNFMNATTQDAALNFEAVFTEATTNYTVQLTGINGCTTSGVINIATDSCVGEISCGFFNGLDTLRAEIEDSLAVVCLPISDMDIAEFEFLRDGDIYEMTFGECNDASIFYGFNAATLGTPPFLLQEWVVNGDTLQNFEFNTAEELVNQLNEFDQEANWVMADDFGFIGISGMNDYGPLKLLHIASNTSLELQLNNMNITFQSLMLRERGVQTFVVRDTMMGCQDSLVIKIDESIEEVPANPNTSDSVTTLLPMDTLYLTTRINTPLINQCMTNSSTIIDSVTIQECKDPENGFLLLQDNNCFNYTPTSDFIGEDSFCIVVCSPTLCDSTYVIVTVGGSDSLQVYNAFSPNNDNINDVFVINGIENYSQNNIQVFNRWGNRVYVKENYTNDWTGTFDNGIDETLLLPDGTYFYLLEVVDNDGQPKSYSGYLQIIR